MPFDTSPAKSQETLNCETLLWHLRNDETTRREWDFAHLATCAMGLCRRLGFDYQQIGFGREDHSALQSRIFDRLFRVRVEYDDAGHIRHQPVARAQGYNQILASAVTPDMVADAIEAEVAKQNGAGHERQS